MAASQTVAPIQYQDMLGPIVEAGKYLAGTKTGGATTVRGETGPLYDVLGGLNSESLQALVSNLFSQGAAKVPGLSSAYAGATGTRATNNSMLGLSLAQLNQSLAESIANAVVQQQQLQVQAAGKIAETNKSTNTSSTTQPGSTSRALRPVLAGFGLNQIGKFQDKKAAAAAADKAPMEGGITFDNSQQLGIPPEVPNVGDLGAFNEMAPNVISGVGDDLAAQGISSGLEAGLEALAPAAGEAFSSDYADYAYDAFSAVPEITDYADYGSSLADFFFRDGGRVGTPSYADGGSVRGRPQMGPRGAATTTRALNLQGSAPAPVRKRGGGTPAEADAGVSADSSGVSAGVSGVAGQQDVVSAIANMSPMQVATMMAQLSIGIPPTSIAMNQVISQVGKKAINEIIALFQEPPPDTTVVTSTSMPPAISIDAEGNPIAPMPPAVSTFDEFVDPFTVEVSPEDVGIGGDTAGEGAPDADTGSSGTDAPGTGVGEGGSASGTGSGADAGGDAGAGDAGGDAGGAGDGAAYQDGGRVAGKATTMKGIKGDKPKPSGTGNDRRPASKGEEGRFIRGGNDSSGVVNINAHLDEYVLPANTVLAMGGPRALDILVAATNSPRDEGPNG